MERFTTNLWRREFACKCGKCNCDTADHALVCGLQDVVDYFTALNRIKYRIRITSGNRCTEHNLVSGGAKNSQHLYGRAADFKIYENNTDKYLDPKEIYNYLDNMYPNQYGIGLYSNRVHFDTRSGPKARWDESK